tara:strand:+ start:85 stop:258 length:174 start_codon:yes stop_codon:yes gene_type:complete
LVTYLKSFAAKIVLNQFEIKIVSSAIKFSEVITKMHIVHTIADQKIRRVEEVLEQSF